MPGLEHHHAQGDPHQGTNQTKCSVQEPVKIKQLKLFLHTLSSVHSIFGITLKQIYCEMHKSTNV